MSARRSGKRAPLVGRLVAALRQNCRGYTDRGRSYRVFSKRNGRIWDMARAAGVDAEVLREVVPPLRADYPRWAAMCDATEGGAR